MKLKTRWTQGLRTGLLAIGLVLSLGMSASPGSSVGNAEFENLATRSENMLVGAGLADKSSYFGGVCPVTFCEYQPQCGQDCVCVYFGLFSGVCMLNK